MRFDPSQTSLAGVPTATLQQWLSDAQATLHALNLGQRIVTGTYDGKSVTYTEADRAFLEAWIYLLQRQLGLVRPRRALTPYFR